MSFLEKPKLLSRCWHFDSNPYPQLKLHDPTSFSKKKKNMIQTPTIYLVIVRFTLQTIEVGG